MNFWDKKYKSIEKGYGLEPNEFFKQNIYNKEVGRMLLPGEGEGRNAIYAAKLGWDVTAFDMSIVAKQNALLYAKEHGIRINYLVEDVESFSSSQKFDLISIVYLHLFPDQRSKFHTKLSTMLKNNGKLIMEVFSKDQLSNNSGGPKDVQLLYSLDDIKNDFTDNRIEYLQQEEIILNEGDWHQGKANVIRAIITKK
jgi:SAM-dependent methyltransferase